MHQINPVFTQVAVRCAEHHYNMSMIGGAVADMACSLVRWRSERGLLLLLFADIGC